MFRNAQVGDRVWDYERDCWGTIVSINNECHYPLKVKLDNKYSEELYYTIDGKSSTRNVNPSLFWNEIKIDIQQKPFNLEKELRKLEKINFISEESNCMLAWDSETNKVILMECACFEIPNVDYFTKKSIEEFVRTVKYENVTKEEFFDAYEKVFG